MDFFLVLSTLERLQHVTALGQSDDAQQQMYESVALVCAFALGGYDFIHNVEPNTYGEGVHPY